MSHERALSRCELVAAQTGSARLDTSVNHVSQAINSGLQSNFFQCVNRHRVEAAAAKLLESDAPILTSRLGRLPWRWALNPFRRFYTAFHKATGQAPGAYRRGVKKGSIGSPM